MFKDDKLDFEASGFDTADMYQLFGDSPLVNQPEELVKAAERVRAAREAYDKTVSQSSARDDTDFYIVAVFRDSEDRKKFLDAMGLEENRFVDGKYLTAKLGGL